MRNLITLITGLIFGIGLIMSGMTNPAKVQNFLDFFGNWDPSLALVMGGAILITMPGFWLVQKRQSPFFEKLFHFPTKARSRFSTACRSCNIWNWMGPWRILPRPCDYIYSNRK